MAVNVALISIMLGGVMPSIVAAVVRAHWTAGRKEVTALAASLVAGIVTACCNHAVHGGAGIAESAVVIAAASEGAYRLYWRKSAIGQQLEQWAPFAQLAAAVVKSAGQPPAPPAP